MARTDQPLEDQERTKRIVEYVMPECEPPHKRWRRGANHAFALYNNFQDYRSALEAASPRGRDEVRNDAVSVWGKNFMVPVAFGIVEATVPLIIPERPRMVPTPEDPIGDGNVDNLEFLINKQQSGFDYELVLQEIAKTCGIYGIGIQKVYWDTRWRRKRTMVPSEAPRSVNPSGYSVAEELVPVYDDPRAESIDPFDFFWDPHAKDIETCGYVVQRSWRPLSYIADKVKLGEWRNCDDLELTAALGNSVLYDEAWGERMRALGFSNLADRGSNRVHEVLECHSTETNEVITILDRELCVASMDNPHWHGDLPFQAYRCTQIPGRFEGKGLIEPVEGLVQELNELRADRRNNARLILQQCFAFHDGMLDVDDFKFGPGLGIPVNGDPREILFPIPTRDIPYAGYQEETALQGDIRFAAGLSDPNDSSGVQETATGAQLVHAATSRRADLMTRRLVLELLVKGTRQMAQLNQQHILSRTVRIDHTPRPGEPDRRWSWKTLTPAELAGEFSWTPEGQVGVQNVPQERSDAQDLWTIGRDNPGVDPQALMIEVFKRLGIRHPESLIAAPKAGPPDNFLPVLAERLVSLGLGDRGKVNALIASTLDEALAEQAQASGAAPPAGPATPPPPELAAAAPPTNGGPPA